MAKPTIVTRASKGSALTWTEGDANLTNLRDATITIQAGTGGTAVVSDLNGTVTLVAGTNITLTGDNTAKTVTIDSTASGGLEYTDFSAGMGLQYDNTTGEFKITDSGLPMPITGTVTAIDGDTDYITLNSVTGLSMSYQISFQGANLSGSGIMLGTPYYITNIDYGNNKIQINSMMSGTLDLNTVADTSGITWSASSSTPGGSGQYSLQYNSSSQTMAWAQEVTPTNPSLSSLSDVMVMMPGDGDILVYDSAMQRWQNEVLPSIPGTTDSLTEGTTNFYFTTARARSSLSAGTGISYDNLTGVITSTVTPGITDVVDDTTPQLGGNLDVNGKSIVSVSNGNIVIAPNGTGTTTIKNAQLSGEVRIADLDGSNFVGFKAPDTVSTNKIWTLPAADGSNGQVLSTNGSGALSWATPAGGGGGNSYAILEANTYNTSINAGTGTLNPGWTEISDIGSILTTNGSSQFTLGAGTYLITFTSAGMLASGGVSSNTKANTGGIYFDLYSVTASTVLNRYYQEASQFWTGSATSFEIAMGPVVLQSLVTPSVSTTYEIRYSNSGLQKQFNNFSSPGKSFRIVVIKIA